MRHALPIVAALLLATAAAGCIFGEGEPENPTPDLQATIDAVLAIISATQTVSNADSPTPIATIVPPTTRTASGPTPTVTLTLTATSTSAPTPPPTLAPTRVPSPELRHIEEKGYMLELINAERTKAGVGTLTLGNNVAAQLHAESALENCFSSHWGMDGLKPYMRYSLAGGYQSNGENGHGLDYCIKRGDGYRANDNIQQEIKNAMAGWMSSPGHQRNLLDPQHKKVNIGIAWDKYNTAMYQHFEGDYVEYNQRPAISSGVVSFSGTTKNGVQFAQERDLTVFLYFDPPPHTLTRGQLARTYCYASGRLVAALRPPLVSRNSYYTTHEFNTTYSPCPSPYDAAADALAPRSPAEAHRAWEEAYKASRSHQSQSTTVPWITALEWIAEGTEFVVEADIGVILDQHGHGVYTILVWGENQSGRVTISEYSIFHGVTPPNTYDRGGG